MAPKAPHFRTILLLWVCLCIGGQSAAATLQGKAYVLDGDTLTIGVAQVRLYGLDAPEEGQRCGRPDGSDWACDRAATERLVELAEDRDTVCDILDVDVYGRLVATCEVAGVDLGKTLVEEGLGWAFIEYADDYVPLETAARDAGRGIWEHGADPETPSAYRANRWQRAAASSPRPGCPIKGNISRGDNRIYHTPWSKYYGRTRIDIENGERWFCDEAEAISAGWRPARSR